MLSREFMGYASTLRSGCHAKLAVDFGLNDDRSATAPEVRGSYLYCMKPGAGGEDLKLIVTP
jgi:hypothetical protein